MTLDFDELRTKFEKMNLAEFTKAVKEISENKDSIASAEDWYELGVECEKVNPDFRLECFLVYIKLKKKDGLKSIECYDVAAARYFELGNFQKSFLYASDAFKKKPETNRALLLLSLFDIDKSLISHHEGIKKDCLEWLQEHQPKLQTKAITNVKTPTIVSSGTGKLGDKGKKTKKGDDSDEEEEVEAEAS